MNRSERWERPNTFTPDAAPTGALAGSALIAGSPGWFGNDPPPHADRSSVNPTATGSQRNVRERGSLAGRVMGDGYGDPGAATGGTIERELAVDCRNTV